ncbi:hypothetical protein CTAYLR_001509 [Chrysophaeum taylorii]|uniref:Uncharacterized protein n=1 Tax=Chrysophaeum taylorii TaxID=2483200 RepID=A0AAD7UD71_9STRA|nr:hypothetical protein CTAYLR_001509 [Chrysophaeum taylorii]
MLLLLVATVSGWINSNSARPAAATVFRNNKIMEREPEVVSTSSSKKQKRRLLSQREEAALSHRVQRLLRLETVRKELNSTLARAPSDAEWCEAASMEWTAFECAIREGTRAKSIFVSANLPLVTTVAKRYRYTSSLDYNDLLQEGTFGLTRAVERFNPSLGYRFSTYAVWWIRQAISAAVLDQSRVIRLPPKLHRDLLNLERVKREFEEAVGREPTDSELAEALDLCASKVGFLKDCTRTSASPVVSFECPRRGQRRVGSDAGSPTHNKLSLTDLLADESTNPFEFAQSREVKAHIAELFRAALNLKECMVLKLSFGLDDGRPHSLDQIAKIMSMSASNVRAIKAKALHKLRQPHSGNHILKAHYQHSL